MDMVLKDCSRCMVYTPEGKRLSEAAVIHTKDYIFLYFEGMNMRDARVYTTVDFYDDRVGLVRAICELLVHRNPSFPEAPYLWMADCTIKEVKGTLQRQQDIRARVNIDVGFESENHGSFYGKIKNISAGGLYLVTKQPLDRNEKISFQYTFRAAKRTFLARTIRGRRVGNEDYGYGCRFIDLSENAEAVIREYVFKVLKEKDQGRRERA